MPWPTRTLARQCTLALRHAVLAVTLVGLAACGGSDTEAQLEVGRQRPATETGQALGPLIDFLYANTRATAVYHTALSFESHLNRTGNRGGRLA